MSTALAASLKYAAGFVLLSAMVQLGGCSTVRQVSTPAAKVIMVTQGNLNPDDQGRASPVAVRIFELATRTALDSLDFATVWNNSATVLGEELLSSSQHVMLPGQTFTHRIKLAPQAQYIAVIAAYRRLDDVRWKLVYPVNSDWFNTRKVFFSACGLGLEKATDCRMGETDVQP